jgi:hypothetical protein
MQDPIQKYNWKKKVKLKKVNLHIWKAKFLLRPNVIITTFDYLILPTVLNILILAQHHWCKTFHMF